MTAPAPLPLLFLDVDGPLIPFGARPGGHRTYPMGPVPPGAAAHPLLARVDPSLGPRLGALPCTLVWATTGRAFAWVDDEIGEPDRRWVAGHHGGPALLHRVDPVLGLTGADLRLIEAWLRSV
ncbi:hypothetical protein [Streptomyces sp. NPDC056010]|uniref:hypothetical protein n=1 Tax=Streptomyces sp. NPDC056010 TaxID=3345679 RepID=UPI0035E314FA